MPGDGLISDPTEMSMQAVTVDAPPENIWPWLVQIGYQRGGMYSYDWLDRLFGFLDRPSASRILPEFQQLAVGEKVPWGRTGTELTVGVLEPLRALALSYEAGGFAWVWQFALYPLSDERTRLVTRGTERVPETWAWWLGMRVMEPAAFIMTRRMLLNLK
ncbi:MAG TPA: SRPBCC family protein, partial [Mycobacterium sp.]|nr:SRPBCC family protein [Mycobacterium sp.]